MMKTILVIISMLVPASAQEKFRQEPEAEARARYAVIAEAIAGEVGGDIRLARFLLTVAKHESSFARSVHSGKKKGDAGWSWGLYQIRCGRHPGARVPGTKYQAHEIVGVDLAATKRATNAAAGYLRRLIRVCKGEPLCVFRGYGGVSRTYSTKVGTRLNARVKTYKSLTRRKK